MRDTYPHIAFYLSVAFDINLREVHKQYILGHLLPSPAPDPAPFIAPAPVSSIPDPLHVLIVPANYICVIAF